MIMIAGQCKVIQAGEATQAFLRKCPERWRFHGAILMNSRTFLSIAHWLLHVAGKPLLLRSILSICLFAATIPGYVNAADQSARWSITADGAIVWKPSLHEVHQDFIEMGGEQIAFLIRYGVDTQGVFSISHSAVWPMLRFHPNETESHLRMSFGEDANFGKDMRFSPGLSPGIFVRNGASWQPISNRVLRRVYHKGIARFEGTVGSLSWYEGEFVNREDWSKLSFRRAIFPSTTKPVAFDATTLTNLSQETLEIDVRNFERNFRTAPEIGIYGAYVVTQRLQGAGVRTLRPGESTTFSVIFEARKSGDASSTLDVAAEERARIARVEQILGKLQLDTPDEVLNTAFAFAKLRATESIVRTRGGLMHAPANGVKYYAAIWANDQAEYANPFFGMSGDPIAAESAINSFRHFARFMNVEYKPIPSSIISEGANFWNGAGDRGDMAMIAYGATRFALAYGDKQSAEELWPLIEWSLEYLRRKVTAQGVVASDSDELEGRFPAGKANLCTSALYYDALKSAVMLGSALGKNKTQLQGYAESAIAVRAAIERYFGANVEGFDTYRYYDKLDLIGHPKPQVAAYASRPDVLRAWIAIPLTVDIFDRKAGTIDALFSPRLWTEDGLATEAGQITFWDRSTLYALRGVLAAGDMKRGLEHLRQYSSRRLLGDHVPYPFEAYPEGGKAQLAAEGALYCRVFTEGLFGIRPTGLRSFSMSPRLPDDWPSMALRNVHAFGGVFDLNVKRIKGGRLSVELKRDGRNLKTYTIKTGEAVSLTL
jgi:hypothetical protein